MKPQFSIVITSHQRPHLLTRTLQSLTMQDTENFEVIVAMDFWCNDSVQVVNDFTHPYKKLLVLPGFKGPAETRNIGKDQARGDWVLFLDDDDQLIPGYLGDIISHLQDRQHIVWTNYLVQQEIINGSQFESLGWEEKVIDNRSVEELEISNFIPNCALVYPKEVICELDFDLHLSSLEDWDLLIQAKRKFPMKPLSIFSSVISMPVNEITRNSGSQKSSDHFMDIIHIYRKWRSDHAVIRELRLKKLNNRQLNINADHM